MRSAFGDELALRVAADPMLMVLDGDCATSTMSVRVEANDPGAFLNVGIAEQNMVGVGAGLAAVGYRVVLNSFAAMLVHRAGEQLLQSVALPGHHVIVAGHYAGLSAGREGAPHHAIADLGAVLSMPGFTVWTPFDDDGARAALAAACQSPGPHYLRLSRNPVTVAPPRTDGLVACWTEDPYQAPAAKTPPVALTAVGDSVRECLVAQRLLAERGIGARVVAPRRLKPFPAAELRQALRGCDIVFSIEEHNTIGGLGSALGELDDLPARRVRMGIADHFTETGSPDELRQLYGLDAAGITDAVSTWQKTPNGETP